MANTNTVSPKVGFAYDLTGDNRTVIKGFYGLSRWNSADVLADQENPVGLAQLRYAFVSCARRPDHRLRPQRRSPASARRRSSARSSPSQGGGGFVRVDRDLVRPISHEVSFNLEREMRTGLSGRASYVYKNMRNVWGEIDVLRDAAYTVPFTFNDPGARSRRRHRRRSGVHRRMALAAGTGQDRVFTNTEDDADFHNVEFAVNRRFSGSLDDADLVRPHLVDDVSRQHRRQRGAAGHRHHHLSADRSPVRRQRHRDVDAVELQARSAAT